MKQILTVITIVFLCSLSLAQVSPKSQKRLKEQAEALLEELDYQTARIKFEEYASSNPNDPEVHYKIGICYLHSLHQEKALEHFKKAKFGNFESGTSIEIHKNIHGKWVSDDLDFNLAYALQLHHEFDQAIHYYLEFETKIKTLNQHKSDYYKIVNRLIETCRNGVEFIKNPHEGLEIENLGAQINSEFPEYSPIINAHEDVIIFTSRRPGSTGNVTDFHDDDLYMEDIYISKKSDGIWSDPIGISASINSSTHDAALGLSPDGHTLFIYRSNEHGTGDIYYSFLEGKHWTPAAKLPQGINTKYFEASASITNDGKKLYFTSDRPGGQGERDIYVVERITETTWGIPENLGATINTSFSEESAFIHPDGKTLYFSSKGHKSMGGYDIFKSELDKNTGNWSSPVNMGYPINSADDDLFFVFSADGQRAYFSTHREDSYGDKDIYVMHTKSEKVSLIVLKGVVKSNINNEPLASQIEVTDLDSGKSVGSFVSNSNSGAYTLVLHTGKNYAIHTHSEGFLPFSKNINISDTNTYHELHRDLRMQPMDKNKNIVMNNVFFKSNGDLDPLSKTELDAFVKLLKQHPELCVEIAGHLEGKNSYIMSGSHAQKVKRYFVKQGIADNRILAIGYGSAHKLTQFNENQNNRIEFIIREFLDDTKEWVHDNGYYSKH